MIATVVIWKAPSPPPTEVFRSFAVTPPPPPPPQPPSSSSAAAENPQFEPQPTVVPVVSPPSIVTTQNYSSYKVDTTKALDQAFSHLNFPKPQGTGIDTHARLGNEGSGGGGGGGGDYGSSTGVGLRGSFYDLKQTPDGNPTDIAENDVEKQVGQDNVDPNFTSNENTQNGIKFLSKFVRSWDSELLNKYYKASDNLFLPQICIPVTASSEATKAYNVQANVVARRWIAYYHATIIPPESGTFRFVGCADDFMVVRLDQKNVLDASVWTEVIDPTARTEDKVGNGFEGFPLVTGLWFTLEKGTPVKVKVLIGEGPGGHSAFMLLIQKQGDHSLPGDYPIFQLQDVKIPPMDCSYFSGKKMLFQVANNDDDNGNGDDNNQ